VPIIVVFLTAFAMSSIVFSVLEQAIQGTIMCLVDDEDKHGGNARYAPAALLEATGVSVQFEADQKEAALARKGGGCCGSAPVAA
jgi:hypothetical protein